jgi:hypothetical protein
MSETTQQYQPGDIVNGYVLDQDGSWQPLPPAAPATPATPERKKHRARKFVGIAAAAVATIGVITQVTGGDDTTSTEGTYAHTKVAEGNVEAPEADAPAEQAPAEQPPAEDDAPTMTAAQENAVASAQDYLDYGAFSRKGLIDQLEFEGYSTKDATYAVDHIEVDWNEQAAASAKDYLDYDSFSHKGLVDQLKFEGFTPEQAEYGVTQAGL